MALSIPNAVFDHYFEAVDWFIDSEFTGHVLTLVYPPKKVECSNCIVSHFGGVSKNVYRHGGPAPFNMGSCPVCGGNGIREDEVTGSIRTRLYWSKKDFVKVGGFNLPNSHVQIIGRISDLDKLRRAVDIIVNKNNMDYRFKLAAEPFDWGFGNKYFVAFLERK